MTEKKEIVCKSNYDFITISNWNGEIYKIKSSKNLDYDGVKLGRECYVSVWISDNPAYTENCDSVLGYSFLFKDKEEIGGEYDFNSEEKNYFNINDAVPELLNYWFEEKALCITSVENTELDTSDFFY